MKGYIAARSRCYYSVVSTKDLDSGKWKRKWLGGHGTKKEAEKTLKEAVA